MALRTRAGQAGFVAEAGPEGWAKSEVDPEGIVRVFKSLRIKPGIRLRAYQFRADSNGNGIVYALRGDEFPEPAECRSGKRSALREPKPHNALPYMMDAIEGDGSPLSYISASILLRELAEFGAIWHGCSWSDERILGEDPRGNIITDIAAWQWSKENIEWRPSVARSKGLIVLSFCTFIGLGVECVTRHEDSYRPGSYSPASRSELIGSGPVGYIH